MKKIILYLFVIAIYPLMANAQSQPQIGFKFDGLELTKTINSGNPNPQIPSFDYRFSVPGWSNIVLGGPSQNVGIGTSNPTAKLEIAEGTLKISDLGDGSFGMAMIDQDGNLFKVPLEPGRKYEISTESQSPDGTPQIKVFPNPIGSSKTLQVKSSEKVEEVSLFNTNGEKVATGNGSALSTDNLPRGRYVLRVVVLK